MHVAFLLHWNEAECEEHASRLRALGFEVREYWNTETTPHPWEPTPPDVCVISLDRLPSHGKAVAKWIVEAKYRREKPLIFVAGNLDRLASAREDFPNAYFGTWDDLAHILNDLGIATF